MKRYGRIHWVVGLAACGLCTAGLAQGTDVTTDPTRERDGQELTITAETRTQTQTETALQDAAPEGMERDEVSPRVQSLLREFADDHAEYLQQLQQRQRESRGISEEDRERIRARIRIEREGWWDLAQAIRSRARERLQALKDALPSHQDMLEQARDKAREQVRQGVENARERRPGLD